MAGADLQMAVVKVQKQRGAQHVTLNSIHWKRNKIKNSKHEIKCTVKPTTAQATDPFHLCHKFMWECHDARQK